MKSRPKRLADLQMAAAVGQTHLMNRYEDLFKKHNITIGQILLTHDDLRVRSRHINARNAIQNLLKRRLIPVVNENDVVSVDEIKFGDNDQLASLVWMLVDAEAMVMLTTVGGLMDYSSPGSPRVIPFVTNVNSEALGLVKNTKNVLSVGGMASKLNAVSRVVGMGGVTAILPGRDRQALRRLLSGERLGTVIGVGRAKGAKLPGRKRWLAFFTKPRGTIVVDDGAAAALTVKRSSLLPKGVIGCQGSFKAGDLVSIARKDDVVVAHGLVSYSREDVELIRGKHSSEVVRWLGPHARDEIVHRDNLVLIPTPE